MKCSDGHMDLVVFKNAVVDSILLLCSHRGVLKFSSETPARAIWASSIKKISRSRGCFALG